DMGYLQSISNKTTAGTDTSYYFLGARLIANFTKERLSKPNDRLFCKLCRSARIRWICRPLYVAAASVTAGDLADFSSLDDSELCPSSRHAQNARLARRQPLASRSPRCTGILDFHSRPADLRSRARRVSPYALPFPRFAASCRLFCLLRLAAGGPAVHDYEPPARWNHGPQCGSDDRRLALRGAPLAQPCARPAHGDRRDCDVLAFCERAKHPSVIFGPNHFGWTRLVGLPSCVASFDARRSRLLHVRSALNIYMAS